MPGFAVRNETPSQVEEGWDGFAFDVLRELGARIERDNVHTYDKERENFKRQQWRREWDRRKNKDTVDAVKKAAEIQPPPPEKKAEKKEEKPDIVPFAGVVPGYGAPTNLDSGKDRTRLDTLTQSVEKTSKSLPEFDPAHFENVGADGKWNELAPIRAKKSLTSTSVTSVPFSHRFQLYDVDTTAKTAKVRDAFIILGTQRVLASTITDWPNPLNWGTSDSCFWVEIDIEAMTASWKKGSSFPDSNDSPGAKFIWPIAELTTPGDYGTLVQHWHSDIIFPRVG